MANLVPVLQWRASPGATTYDVQISAGNKFNAFVLNQSGVAGTSQGVAPGTLLPRTTYFWRVRAVSASGASLWVIASFRTA